MTANEKQLLDLIGESKDPAKAAEIAVKVILDFLALSESCQGQAADSPLGSEKTDPA